MAMFWEKECWTVAEIVNRYEITKAKAHERIAILGIEWCNRDRHNSNEKMFEMSDLQRMTVGLKPREIDNAE